MVPEIKAESAMTLNLYPDLKTGRVQTNFPGF
jgi:hypothetical protein